MLEITTKMENCINEKENAVKHLNRLCDDLVALEIKESNVRASIFVKMEQEADGKRVTDKAKTAEADKVLKHELNKIKHLKNSIAKERRHIELLNDKISLQRSIIRELEL